MSKSKEAPPTNRIGKLANRDLVARLYPPRGAPKMCCGSNNWESYSSLVGKESFARCFLDCTVGGVVRRDKSATVVR